MSKHPRLVALLGSAMLTAGSLAPAAAFQDVIDLTEFTLGCAGLLLTNPEQHVAVCNPKMPTSRFGLTSDGGNTPDRVSAPPAAPPDPEPEVPDIDPPDDCAARAFWNSSKQVVLVATVDFDMAEVVDCPTEI